MTAMFIACDSLVDCDLSGFDTSKVTSMRAMFNRCATVPDVTSFDTSACTDMQQMFKDCSRTTVLDLSSFDMSNVTDMYMFTYCCNSVQYLYTPKNIPDSFSGYYYLGLPYKYNYDRFYDVDGKSYEYYPTNKSESILLKLNATPTKEENKYYLPEPAYKYQSFWNLNDKGLLDSYTSEGKLLRDGVYNLAYYDEKSGDIWFGSWKFDANGKIVVGESGGRKYNNSTTNGYPYGIDMFEEEKKQIDGVLPSEIFSSYSYMGKYTQDLDTIVTLENSTLNFSREFWAFVKGFMISLYDGAITFDEVIQKTADQYMNDEVKCKELLKEMVSKHFDDSSPVSAGICDAKNRLKPVKTTAKKISEPLSKEISAKMKKDKKALKEGTISEDKYVEDYRKALEAAKDSELEYDGLIVSQVTGTVMTMLGDANNIVLSLSDYTEVINYLEEIENAAPLNSPLRQAAKDLRWEYEDGLILALKDTAFDAIDMANGWSKLLNGLPIFPNITSIQVTGYIEQDLEANFISLIDLAFGTKFGAYQKLFDLIKKYDVKNDATDALITSVTMRANAMETLKKAEEKVFNNPGVSAEDYYLYVDMFKLTQDMTIYQYEKMSEFYGSDYMKKKLVKESREFVNEFLAGEVDKLESIEIDAYNVPAASNDKSEFLFDKDGHTAYYLQGELLKNTWKKIDGRTYHFNNDGYADTGFLNIDIPQRNGVCALETYYFSTGDKSCEADMTHQGSMVTGLKKLDDGYYYYFDERGRMKRNCIVSGPGKYIEIDKQGRCNLNEGRLPTATEIKKNSIVHKINCPVDVAAYDKEGNKVAEIINNQVVLQGNDLIVASVDQEGQKIITADKSAGCNLRITATAEGQCNYSITSFDEEGNFESKAEYNEIEIAQSDVIEAISSSLVDTDGEEAGEYYSLKKDDYIAASNLQISQDYVKVNIVSGDIKKEKVVERGDFVEIALDEDQYADSFKGWYADDLKISEDKICRVQANSNMTVAAKNADYVIVYDANDRIGETLLEECKSGMNMTVLENPYDHRDDLFVGWNTKSDGTGTAYLEQDVIDSGTITDDIVLYAQWVPYPEIDSFSLTVAEGNIGLNCYIKNIPDAIKGSGNGKLKVGSSLLNITNLQSDGTYKFTMSSSPKRMGDPFNISLQDKNGKQITLKNGNNNGAMKYSVMDYLEAAKEKGGELAELAQAMETYGLCSQEYFGYNAQAKEIEVEDIGDLSKYKKSINNQCNFGAKYIGSSLILSNKISIRHYFYLPNGLYRRTAKLDDKAVSETYVSDNIYYFEVSGISGNNLSRTYKLEIYDNYNIRNAFYLSYSVLSYAYDTQTKGKNDSLIKLINSMYNYSVANQKYYKTIS